MPTDPAFRMESSRSSEVRRKVSVIPYPWEKQIPLSSWYFRMTASGIGAPPAMKKWTWEKSAVGHSSVLGRSWNMTGTANM